MAASAGLDFHGEVDCQLSIGVGEVANTSGELGSRAPQQVVRRGQEPPRAGITLASGAAQQLAIDARRIMILDADDVQAAGRSGRLV